VFWDSFVGTVKARVHEAELSEDRKRVPWTGYGVDGGFPGTVVTAVEITNLSGPYDLPADMVDDLGNPTLSLPPPMASHRLLAGFLRNSGIGASWRNRIQVR